MKKHGPCGSAPECEHCESYLDSVFASLPPEGLQYLNTCKTFVRLKKGEVVFRTGDVAKALYCLQGGVVKLETESSEGKGHILRVVSGGEILGYRALFADEPYQATAVVHEESSACVVPKQALLHLLKEYPEATLKILAVISKDLRASESRMVGMSDKDSSSRTAEALLFLKERFPEQKWTRKDIAEWAGTAPETVMRFLAIFETEGWIRQEGRRIDLLNRRALLEHAGIVDG